MVTTNENDWKYFNQGPVVYSSLDMGEAYDATREAAIEGWTTAAYNDSRGKRQLQYRLRELHSPEPQLKEMEL